jgi:hydrogenase maturation protease
MDLVVIGCGNPLRGDDAVGPELVRRLRERGLPDGVRCVDAGTGGIDAVLEMRGALEAVVVDACRSGSPPGTLHEVSGAALADQPPRGLDIHAVRWDHALALADALLGDGRPRQVTACLVEAASFEPGAPLSPAVDRAVDALAARLFARFAGEA